MIRLALQIQSYVAAERQAAGNAAQLRLRHLSLQDEDIAAWLELQNAAFSSHRPIPWTRRHFERELPDRTWWRNDCTWLAELTPANARPNDENVMAAGTVSLEVRGKEAEIHWLAVHPRYQTMGIGRRLIEQSIADCQQRNIERLFAETLKDSNAERFYRARGFLPET